MIILGIETSCDETALALIETQGEGSAREYRVIASLILSQAELHSAYGGVYPTLAKREHGKNIVPLLHRLFEQAGLPRRSPSVGQDSPAQGLSETLDSFRTEVGSQNPELFESFAQAEFLEQAPAIDLIAVTEGPGLEPALWVGINCARMLAALWGTPLLPVNHMEGHIIGSLLPSDLVDGAWQKLYELPLPAVALLASGGHTELVRIDSLAHYEIVGETRDDAVGEAFDKAARLLGLPYPGGPRLAELSAQAATAGIISPVKLPRPMLGSDDLDFSFSGLKTAVLYAVRDADKTPDGQLPDDFKKGLAREFEQAVVETLDTKLRSAIEKIGARSIVIGGGVSANLALRERFGETAREHGIPIFLPSRHIAGDNALMIALSGAIGFTTPRTEKLRAQGTKRLGEE
ncbi:MAG: tRNA (adenosine(37)-N6)-threonylcarbamoyltransferase complex transferase subunit TsaD [Candidatus Paceibacterota bacterium]